MATFQFTQLNLPPGHRVFIDQVSWAEAEALWGQMPGHFDGFGKVYFRDQIELMAPLPQHTKEQLLLSGFVEDMCLNLGLPFSTSAVAVVAPDLQLAIEPVAGFCLGQGDDNAIADLVVEAEPISRMVLDIYQALKIPELWCYYDHRLLVYVLKNGCYQEQEFSQYFPNLFVKESITYYLKQYPKKRSRQIAQEFRDWLTTKTANDNMNE